MAKRKETKKEKNRKRKILLALLLVVFTGVILTANTYAWFTSNKTITVNSIDVQVTTANGIQVSTDATNWKTIITNTDLNNTLAATSAYSTNTNQLPLKSTENTVIPVSTGGTVASGKLKMYSGELSANATTGVAELTTDPSVEAKGNSGDFVAFDLFFLVSQNSVVKLGAGSSVTTSTGASNKGLKNAARVAWINEGNAATGNVSAAQGLSSGTAATTLIWEPNNNVHTDAAIADALSTYGMTITSSQVMSNYYGVDADINTAVSLNPITPGTNFKQVTPGLKTADGVLAADQDWFSLPAGITKVRFYLWIEGQDVDCENNASGDAISFNMNFVLQDNNP
ncbi:MAG: hypothetical protein IJI58_00475 [Bacilli bacterium]|nr:hypothetical protein [Bacilli bacterium]